MNALTNPAITELEKTRRLELAQYLKDIECVKPSKPGMYLVLTHGRSFPEEELHDWGPDGPCFGPLEYCHITYLSSINIAKEGDHEGTGPMSNDSDPLYFTKELLYYNGMYYGDFELLMHK